MLAFGHRAFFDFLSSSDDSSIFCFDFGNRSKATSTDFSDDGILLKIVFTFHFDKRVPFDFDLLDAFIFEMLALFLFLFLLLWG